MVIKKSPTCKTSIAAACPFCNTMMSDGIKNKEEDDQVRVQDIAELISKAEDL